MNSSLRLSEDLSLSLAKLRTKPGSTNKSQTDSISFTELQPTKSYGFSELSSAAAMTAGIFPQERQKAKSSPVSFAQVASGGWYQSAPHLQLLDDYLLRCERREIRRLMVFMPPRHSKSETISHFLPVWWLGRNPDDNIILASYGQDWADHWGRQARNTLNEFGEPIFGVGVADDSSAAGRWAVTGHRGGFKAAGVGGSITGRGANLLIIDDPVKNQEEAFSAVIHQRNIEWWASTASTRLEPGAVVILMMTRWHPNDLAGFLLGDSNEWTVLKLPAVAEADDPLGRQVGEALWPARYDEAALAEIERSQKRILDGYYWTAMYQQRPQIPEGLLYFDKRSVDYGAAHAEDPRERYDTKAHPEAVSTGEVIVWERPQPGERYYIGADTADGKGEALGSMGDTGGPDRNCAAIYRLRDKVQVAEIYGRQEEHEYAKVLADWGKAYNNAMIGVERNRRSVLVSLVGMKYENLYYVDRPGDLHLTLNTNLVTRRREYGWYTDVKSRPLLLSDLREVVTTGSTKIRSARFWREAGTFINGDPPAAAPGQHDDAIFAHGIAEQVYKLAVRTQYATADTISHLGGMR